MSCDNELELIAENKEVPVVYAIIDQADTAQYIRVERIFVDKEIKPEIISQNPDSLYYSDITVKLIRVANGEEYILERVDGNLEGYVREEGKFATSPNYLYKIQTDDINLVINEEIGLEIEGIFEDRVVTSSTTVLEPPFLLNPKNDGVVSFIPNRQINIGWTPKGDAEIFSVSFHFDITEKTSTGGSVNKTLEWIITTSTEQSLIEADGSDFYSFLVGALEKDPAITRTLNSLEFELIAGNPAITSYISVGQANLGITSSGELPVLSNISDGLGVFGSTYTHRRTGLTLTATSLDSLRNSVLTGDLNFE